MEYKPGSLVQITVENEYFGQYGTLTDKRGSPMYEHDYWIQFDDGKSPSPYGDSEFKLVTLQDLEQQIEKYRLLVDRLQAGN
jgi:hypothetical protein